MNESETELDIEIQGSWGCLVLILAAVSIIVFAVVVLR